MRTPFLKNKLTALGAKFSERNGIEYPSIVTSTEEEYNFVRNGAGVTDFSFAKCYRVPEETGLDYLDDMFPGNVAQLRFGRVLHTFLSNDAGEVVADCYIANNDDEFIIICESLLSDADLDAVFAKTGGAEAGLEDMSATHSLLNIDGYQSWAVAKELFDADVLGLPYLSVERYELNDIEFPLIRSGKTGEFGYTLIVKNENAEAALDTVLEAVKKFDGGLCGVDVHSTLRLDGRFFNIFAEGALVKDPLKMGLQWMIDFEKDGYIGYDAITSRRAAGLTEKVIGVMADKTVDGFSTDAEIFSGDEKVGTIKTTCYSPVLDANVALAIFPFDVAYAGLSLKLASGAEVKTVSLPPFSPKSLTVRLDEM
jgi:glycine cleavage system aminomethyltransferase T